MDFCGSGSLYFIDFPDRVENGKRKSLKIILFLYYLCFRKMSEQYFYIRVRAAKGRILFRSTRLLKNMPRRLSVHLLFPRIPAVLRDLGSEIRCFFWPRHPGWVKNQDPGSGINILDPQHCIPVLILNAVKIVAFFTGGMAFRIRVIHFLAPKYKGRVPVV